MSWWTKILTIGVKPPPLPEIPREQDPTKNWEVAVPKFCRACGAETLVKRYSQFDELTGAEIISYVTAQCVRYKMEPGARPQHTSMQWHEGNGWYGSPNTGFSAYPYASTGSFTSYFGTTKNYEDI